MPQAGVSRTQLTVGRQSRLCDILGAELGAAGLRTCFTNAADGHAVRLCEALSDTGVHCIEVGSTQGVIAACAAFSACGSTPVCLVSAADAPLVSSLTNTAVVLSVTSSSPLVTDAASLASTLSKAYGGVSMVTLSPDSLSSTAVYVPSVLEAPVAKVATVACGGGGVDDGSEHGAVLAALSEAAKGCVVVTDSAVVAAAAAKVLDASHSVYCAAPGQTLHSACGAANAFVGKRLAVALVSEDDVVCRLSSQVLSQRAQAYAVVVPTNGTGANYSLLAGHSSMHYARTEQPGQLKAALKTASGRPTLIEMEGTPFPVQNASFVQADVASTAVSALKDAGVQFLFSTKTLAGCAVLPEYSMALQAACGPNSVAGLVAEGVPVYVDAPVVQVVFGEPQAQWGVPACALLAVDTTLTVATVKAAVQRVQQTGSTFVLAVSAACTPGGGASAALPAVPEATSEQLREVLRACTHQQARLHIASAPLAVQNAAVSVAESLDMVVTTDTSMKGVFPEKHPNWLWSGGSKLASELAGCAAACKVVVVLGSTTSTISADTTFVVAPGEATSSATHIHCTAVTFLQKLAALAKSQQKEKLIAKKICAARDDWKRSVKHEGLRPSAVLSCLQKQLPKDAVFCLDAGAAATIGAESLHADNGNVRMPAANSTTSLPALLGIQGRPTAAVVQGEGILQAYLHTMQLLKVTRSAQPLVLLLRRRERGVLGAPYRLTGRPTPSVAVVPEFDVSAAVRALGGVHKRVGSAQELEVSMKWGAEQLQKGNHAVLEVAVEAEDAYATLAQFLPASLLAAPQSPDAVRKPKNTALSKVQRLVHSAVEPSDYYAPIVRDYDTTFAQAELTKRTESDKFDAWEILTFARANYSSKLAYTEGTHKATYGDMYRRVCNVATYLSAQGVAAGDRVGVITPNIYQCMEAHYAVSGVRGVTLNLNQRLSADELAYVLDNAGPVWVITSARFAPLILDAVKQSKLQTVKGLMWIGEAPDSAPAALTHGSFERVASAEGASGEFQAGPMKADDGCEMYYTSGTTGRPKGVILSHRNVVMHALGCMLEHRHHPGDVWGHIAPIFHLVDAYGMFSITWIGGSHVFIPTFSAENTIAAIENQRITVTNMASTMATLILSHPGVEKRDLSSLQMLSCGGAPLSREVTLRAIAVFGCEVFQSYGMTECCGKISMSLLNKPEVRDLPANAQVDLVCSSGKEFALPGFKMRVLMDNGQEAAPLSGDVGEVQICGPTVFSGYYKNPDATKESFSGPWFKTGDLATVGAHGYINVCDRKKDMILTGGENVYSVEVERTLADHADVKYVGVFAIPHPLMGEVVKAVVELHPNAESTSATLRRHCGKHLADYKVPRELEIVSPMPLTGTGKVAKAELKKREAERRAEKEARKGSKPAASASSGACPDVLNDDTYHMTWSAKTIPSKGSRLSGNWVVFSDASGVGSKISERLTKDGAAEVKTLLSSGIDQFDKASYSAITRDTEGMVFLWPLDHSPVGGDVIDAKVTERVHTMVRALLTIMQAAIAAGVRNTNIWIVTRGAQVDIPDVPSQCTAVNATQQALWGFARVIPAERTGFKCHVVDLCPADGDVTACATAISSEITGPDAGDSHGESAWRARRRYVPNLTLLPMQAAQEARFVADATYVVTGGLGGLGRQLARMMITRWGAKNLVLVSRRKPEADVAAELKALETNNGANIRVESADIADLEATKAFLKRVAGGMPPIKGIFHLAGIVDDGRMEDQTWERFLKTLVPKVDGSVNLHVAAEELKLPLDHFVLFSSIYGVLGYRELTHYAAANSFQDGLCLARRRAGLPGLAVSWGTWADAGMASRFGSGFETYWKGLGMEFVPLIGGMQTLGALCMEATKKGGVHHAGVFPAEWERYLKGRRQLGPHPVAQALTAPFLKKSSTVDTSLPLLLQELSPLSEHDRQQKLEAKLIEMIQDLKEDDDEEVDPTAPVVDIGLTSMHVIDLTVQIGEVTGMEDISPTLVYECVTVRAVAERLLEDLEPVFGAAGGGGGAPSVDPNAPELVQKLQGCPPGDRPSVLKKVLVELTKEILEDDDIEVDVTDPVVELGLTSMHVVDMTQQLVCPPTTLQFFPHPLSPFHPTPSHRST